MINRLRVFLSLLTILCAGCVSHSSGTAFVRSDFAELGVTRYAMAEPVTIDKRRPAQLAGSMMGGALLTELLRAGLDVIDRTKTNSILAEHGFAHQDISEIERAKLGALLNVDAIIVARITEFGEFRRPIPGYKLGLTVEATHLETGSTLWSVLISKSDSGDFTQADCLAVAREASKELRSQGL